MTHLQSIDVHSLYLHSRTNLFWHAKFLHGGDTTVLEAFASLTFLEALKWSTIIHIHMYTHGICVPHRWEMCFSWWIYTQYLLFIFLKITRSFASSPSFHAFLPWSIGCLQKQEVKGKGSSYTTTPCCVSWDWKQRRIVTPKREKQGGCLTLS